MRTQGKVGTFTSSPLWGASPCGGCFEAVHHLSLTSEECKEGASIPLIPVSLIVIEVPPHVPWFWWRGVLRLGTELPLPCLGLGEEMKLRSNLSQLEGIWAWVCMFNWALFLILLRGALTDTLIKHMKDWRLAFGGIRMKALRCLLEQDNAKYSLFDLLFNRHPFKQRLLLEQNSYWLQ